MTRTTAAILAVASIAFSSLGCKSAERASDTERAVGADAELRALWVTRSDYRSEDDVRRILRNAREHHFNVVLWQVRGNATAFYRSDLEPWAWELSGEDSASLGTDPGWDPLAIACEEAHEQGLELHAWVNVFPAWRRTAPPPGDSNQLWNTHRDWFMQNREGEVMWPSDWWTYWYTFLDPGVPEVKQHIHDVMLEIVQKYPVDGLHYDYIRYPAEVGDWAYNATSVTRFKERYKDYDGISPENSPIQWAEWKRAQITEIVQSVSRDVKSLRPEVFISASVLHDWPRAHNDYGQDARTWLSRGIVDATFPMLYSYAPKDFEYVARDHLNHAFGGWVMPGLNAGRSSLEDLVELIRMSRRLQAPGLALFSYGGLFPEHEPGDKARALVQGPFAQRAGIPSRNR
jgi:uncharacterized lipoprotein YddW (UPF0748 family)